MRDESRIRRLIALEAARLMYEEGVGEYRDAKRKAARQFDAGKPLSLGSHLPSNAEIHRELERLVGMYEEDVHPARLLALRQMAFRWMEILEPFFPRLVGSVLSGTVTDQSDIDLHLFADAVEDVEEYLRERGIAFENDVVTVRRGSEFSDYVHLYLEDDGVVIECSVYEPGEIRVRPRSSITGKPMERATSRQLRKIIDGVMADSANE